MLQVALGKAHAVLLTKDGGVYTFGINNKGQCGRFSNLSSKYSAKQVFFLHNFTADQFTIFLNL